MFDYSQMTKEKLEEHCAAYAEAIHELSGECFKLRMRLTLIERNRRMFDAMKEAA